MIFGEPPRCFFWRPTLLCNISQNGNLPQVGVKIKNIRNHHLFFFGRSNIFPGSPLHDRTCFWSPRRSSDGRTSASGTACNAWSMSRATYSRSYSPCPALEKLTWHWKIHHLKMYFLLKMVIFQCHVSFQEGNPAKMRDNNKARWKTFTIQEARPIPNNHHLKPQKVYPFWN